MTPGEMLLELIRQGFSVMHTHNGGYLIAEEFCGDFGGDGFLDAENGTVDGHFENITCNKILDNAIIEAWIKFHSNAKREKQ